MTMKGATVTTASHIIDTMQAVAPSHMTTLSPNEQWVLGSLTAELIRAKPEAMAEYDRFLSIRQRSLQMHEELLHRHLDGKTVLVTGGTGCIGSALMAQLDKYRLKRLVSVSRCITTGWPRQDAAVYMVGDVTNKVGMYRVISQVRPDIIFHVAAQRSPSLAEVEVERTITTNVFGTGNVLGAAVQLGVPQVVCASTGKALRPYSPEVYTASKRVAEWLAADACSYGLLVSAARFTHVIDNSLFYDRLVNWADTYDDSVVRLHDPNIVFYAQSALESAQLLLMACIGAWPGQFRIHAIKDLGWPVSLLDVTLGALQRSQSRTPIYFSGYEPGYEEVSFPGLYDPATAGSISPLINAFEAAAMVDSPCPDMVDAFSLQMLYSARAVKWLGRLETSCRLSQMSMREALHGLSWELLDSTLAGVRTNVLRHTVKLMEPYEKTMSPTHRRITEAVKFHCGM
jgi:Polysaccharide biosynthesis protein